MFNKPSREFQAGLKADERRRVRQDERLRLRRADRESRLQKKRKNFMSGSGSAANPNVNNGAQPPAMNPAQAQQEQQRRQQMLQQLPQYVQGCFSDHPATQFECTQRIRKLLSIEREPPIQAVIDSGVVTRLVQFLKFENFDRLQFEAAWALTNIASGTAESTAVVIRYGAVPIFVKLLESPSPEVQEQAIWALGNIAGDSPECRNLVLSEGALNGLLTICNPANCQTQQQLTLLRNATWTLSNFCRGKPQPPWQFAQLAIRALTIMITSDDDEILQDACWAFSYLSDTDGSNPDEATQIRAITESGALSYLVNLLEHQSAHVRHPALRTIGNIVTGCDEVTQKVLNLNVLKKLQVLLQNDRPPIKREACWTISNITAGSKEQIETVLTHNLFPPLIHVLKHEKYEVAKEALWAISNTTSGGSDVQIAFLVNQGVIPPLCDFLRSDLKSHKCVLVALEGIENVLAVGQRMSTNTFNRFATYVEECGGVDMLEQLQSNNDVPDEIYQKAANIVKLYFNGEDATNAFFAESNSDNTNGTQGVSSNSNNNGMQVNGGGGGNDNLFGNNGGGNGNQNGQNNNMFGFGIGSNAFGNNPNSGTNAPFKF